MFKYKYTAVIVSFCLTCNSIALSFAQSYSYLAVPGYTEADNNLSSFLQDTPSTEEKDQMEMDEISRAVSQITVYTRFIKYALARPSIEKFMRRFIDPHSDDGKKVLDGLANLKIDSQKEVQKKYMYLYLIIAITYFFYGELNFLEFLNKFYFEELFAKPQLFSTWVGLGFFYIYSLFAEKHYLEMFESTTKGDILYMDDEAKKTAFIHELAHYNADEILHLDDLTNISGNAFEYLYSRNKDESPVDEPDVVFYRELTREESRQNLIKKLLKRERTFLSLKKKKEKRILWMHLIIGKKRTSTDDYDTGTYLGKVVAELLRGGKLEDEKDAFSFIVSLFRDLKIARTVESKKVDTMAKPLVTSKQGAGSLQHSL